MLLGQKQVETENSRNCTVHGTVKRGGENAQVSRSRFPKYRKRNDRSRVASINRDSREIGTIARRYACAEAFERRRSSKMAELLLSGKPFPVLENRPLAEDDVEALEILGTFSLNRLFLRQVDDRQTYLVPFPSRLPLIIPRAVPALSPPNRRAILPGGNPGIDGGSTLPEAPEKQCRDDAGISKGLPRPSHVMERDDACVDPLALFAERIPREEMDRIEMR